MDRKWCECAIVKCIDRKLPKAGECIKRVYYVCISAQVGNAYIEWIRKWGEFQIASIIRFVGDAAHKCVVSCRPDDEIVDENICKKRIAKQQFNITNNNKNIFTSVFFLNCILRINFIRFRNK